MRALSLLLLSACTQGTLVNGVGDNDGTVVDDIDSEGTEVPDTIACEREPATEGAWLEDSLDADIAACQGMLHAFGGPAGAVVSLGAAGTHASSTELTVMQVDGTVLLDTVVDGGTPVELELPWSGEFLVEARPADDDASELTLTAGCVASCDAAWTRYPMVFMHGMAGTDSFIGILDYWLGVEDDLTERGYEVSVGAVDPFQVTPVRAEQWAEHIEDYLSDGRHRRVSLIAHSQGGLDARYLAADLDPDGRVRSVTTVGTPHYGTPVADVFAGTLSDARITPILLDGLFDAIGALYGQGDQDIIGQMEQHTAGAMEAFNVDVPDRADVLYASYSGRTCGALEVPCLRATGGEVVNPAFSLTYRVVRWFEGPNDGLIPVTSAEWGIVLDELPADHLDEVGLLLGASAPGFDHRDVYRDHALWLRDQGL